MKVLKNNVCVVGAGYWGQNHIKTLHALGNLACVVESNPKRLNELSKEFPKLKIFSNIDDSFNDERIQGYVVATPAITHYSIAKKIISLGKHVLVEKPLTLNSNEANLLVKFAEEKKVNLMCGHLLLFHPAIIKIKELVTSGKIGRLQYIYSNRLNHGQIRKEENVFWSLAPHDISIFQYLTDSYPTKIDSNGGIFIQDEIFDSTLTFLEYPNNVKSHIFVSWLHPFKEHRIVVIGSDGMIVFEDSSNEKLLEFHNKRFESFEENYKKINGPTEIINYEEKMPLTEELIYFINHLDGKKIDRANGKSAAEVIRILEDATKKLMAK